MMTCIKCGGSGGGEDPALSCRICGGTGHFTEVQYRSMIEVYVAAQKLWDLRDDESNPRLLYNAWRDLGASLAHAKGYLFLGEA